MKSTDEKRKIIRTGSATKTICFSQSQNKRLFEYQNENINRISKEIFNRKKKNQNEKLNILTESTLQHKDFRRVKLFQLADTKRCFKPELNNEPQKITRKNNENIEESRHFSPGNLNSLISKTRDSRNIVNCRKQSNPKVYRSIILNEQFSNSFESKRSIFKKSQFNYYKTTTQIDNLPGGVKRCQDKIPLERQGKSFTAKMMNDYKSNISCLPGTNKKVENIKPNQKRSLFLKNTRNIDVNYSNTYTLTNHESISHPCLTETNSKSSQHLIFPSKKQFQLKSFNADYYKEKPLITHTRLKRPDFIRNPFESQININ